MAQFQLTISSAYVPDWGVYEGVRELIQNALDAQQDGYPMDISHSGGTLRITNQGVRLLRSVWLMGQTSKTGGDYRGHFGEGLKLGVLALVRAGRKVRIVNDDESWSTSIKSSEAFGEPVLTINTRSLSERADAFTVEAEISADEWQQYRARFLAIEPAAKAIATDYGSILLDFDKVGRLYVKGILVESKPALTAGYDFVNASTDRDRRMIFGWDFEYYTARIWSEAWQNGDITAERLLSLLEAPTLDLRGLGERIGVVPAEMISALADAFLARYGANAVPVASQAEKAEIEHLGRYGIISSDTLCKVFSEHEALNLAALRKQCRGEVVAVFTAADLDARERAVNILGTALVEAAATPLGFLPITGRLEIVEFRAEDILGVNHYDSDTGIHHIRVARRCLSSLEQYLRVLVHELAHDRGGDGDVRHERAEGEIFCRIIARAIDGFVPREARQAPVPVLAAA